MSKPPQQLGDIATAIEKARHHGYRWLQLRGLSLTEIPKEIFTLDDIEVLDFSGNNLRTIPERLGDLPKLREVWLLGNPIRTLHRRSKVRIDLPIFRRCHNLLDAQNTTLFIDQTISEKDVDWWLSQLDALMGPYTLIIDDFERIVSEFQKMPTVQIQRILNSLARFDFVKSLALRSLQLDGVPEGIRHIRYIKSLNLEGLGLTALPDWIGELNLESFSAEYNKLSSMPISFGNLKTLRHLNLNWNLWTKIPEIVFELPALQTLSVLDSYIREIPPQIVRLSQLEHFYFDRELIESPPREIAAKGLDAIRNY